MQFVRIGKRYINMAQVIDVIDCHTAHVNTLLLRFAACESHEIDPNAFSLFSITLRDAEADELREWLSLRAETAADVYRERLA